jgi:predicted Zn-dependent protease
VIAGAGIELAERVVRAAARPGDQGVELFLRHIEEAHVDLVPGLRGAATVAGSGLTVAARVWRHGRCGFAAHPAGREEEIAALVSEARAAAMAGGTEAPVPVDVSAAAAGLPRGAELSEDLAHQRAEELRAGLVEAGLPVQVVLLRQRRWCDTVVSLAGVRTEERHTLVTGSARCETERGITLHVVESADIRNGWDPGRALRHAAEARAVIAAASGREPDRRLPLVLRPMVASHLVAGLGWMLRGTTAAATPGLPRAVGRRLFPACLTLVDDPAHAAATLPRGVDGEGRPALRLELVGEGVLRGFLHSTASAAALHDRPNGRALRAAAETPPAPAPVGLHVCPRGDRAPDDHVELTTRLETLSTMSRPGVMNLTVCGWEVRDGRRAQAVGPFDLHLPVLAALRALRGVGNDLELVFEAERTGTPSLHLGPEAWTS